MPKFHKLVFVSNERGLVNRVCCFMLSLHPCFFIFLVQKPTMPNCLSRLVEPRNSVFEHYSLALQKCRAFFFFANKSILKISMLYVFVCGFVCKNINFDSPPYL